MTDSPYCDCCGNTGWVDCYCGGDICVCENNGEYPCPECGIDIDDFEEALESTDNDFDDIFEEE